MAKLLEFSLLNCLGRCLEVHLKCMDIKSYPVTLKSWPLHECPQNVHRSLFTALGAFSWELNKSWGLYGGGGGGVSFKPFYADMSFWTITALQSELRTMAIILEHASAIGPIPC